MTTRSSIWLQLSNKLNQILQSSIEYCTTEDFHTINTIFCLARHLDVSLINESYQLFPYIDVGRLLKKVMNYVLNNTNCFTLDKFVSTCGNLVCLREFSSFSTNDAQTLIAVISLPWINNSNSIFKSLPLYKFLDLIVKKYFSLLSK